MVKGRRFSPVGLLLLMGAMACSGELGGPNMNNPGDPDGSVPGDSDGGGDPTNPEDIIGGPGSPLVDKWPRWVRTTNCEQNPVGDTPLRRLTRKQYDNSVRDLLGTNGAAVGLPIDGKAGPFEANYSSPVTAFHITRYMEVAEAIGADVASRMNAVLPCSLASGEDACLTQFIESFGQRAFRRPVDPSEVTALKAVYTAGKQSGSAADGVRLLVAAMLQSPDFLYLVESKVATSEGSMGQLTGYEMATRLSYFLWNTTPDQELLEAARAGQLDTAEGVKAQTERLLASDRAATAMSNFHYQWLDLGRLETMAKNPKRYLRFSEDARAAMRNETERFTDYVVRKGDGTLHTLLTAQFSFLEDSLFPIYGISKPRNFDPSKPVSLLPDQRRGVLTHPSVLTSHAQFDESSPVRRGIFILENLFCFHVNPPPPTVPIPPVEEPTPGQPLRVKFEQHTSNPICATCHMYIDPLGFGFEHYDAVGQWRTQDNLGNEVNAEGDLVIPGEDHTSGKFYGAVELSDRLLNSWRLQDCVPRQWHRFALGRDELPEDVCSVSELQKEFIDSNYNVRELITRLVTKDSFRFRPNTAQ